MSKTTRAILILSAAIIALLGANIIWIRRNIGLKKDLTVVKSEYNKEVQVAIQHYQTACALSDIVRCHLDHHTEPQCGFEEEVCGYLENLDAYNYDIDTIDWCLYSWCY